MYKIRLEPRASPRSETSLAKLRFQHHVLEDAGDDGDVLSLLGDCTKKGGDADKRRLRCNGGLPSQSAAADEHPPASRYMRPTRTSTTRL